MNLVILVILAAVGTAFVIEPLLAGRSRQYPITPSTALDELRVLVEQKDGLLEDIRELEFEYEAGKLSERDFEGLRTEAVSRIAHLYERIDHVRLAVDPGATTTKRKTARFEPLRTPSKLSSVPVDRQTGSPPAAEGKFCLDCSGQNPVTARFCGDCGDRFPEKACVDCGEPVTQNACFCIECGANVA